MSPFSWDTLYYYSEEITFGVTKDYWNRIEEMFSFPVSTFLEFQRLHVGKSKSYSFIELWKFSLFMRILASFFKCIILDSYLCICEQSRSHDNFLDEFLSSQPDMFPILKVCCSPHNSWSHCWRSWRSSWDLATKCHEPLPSSHHQVNRLFWIDFNLAFEQNSFFKRGQVENLTILCFF